MTDLDRAHDKLIAVRAATDTDARFDALYQAVCRMWDHLEAQPTTTADYDPTAMDQARKHLRGLGAPCSDPAADAQAVGRFADAVAALLDQLVARADEITRRASALLTQAVEATQEVTSAPQTAPEAEAGQGDGGEAERAAEGHPAEAVRAVSAALHLDACTDDAHDGCDAGDWTREAETAIAAAEPHIRAKTLAPIRAALANHPRCDIHPDDDPIKCGWKQAVADIQAVLDRQEQPR